MTFQDRILRRLQKNNNFRYLDDLVNSGKNEVKLTCDIALEDSEELVYGEGIEIKTDDLTIDGNGYQIDAKGKARIFNIENKNVTFKNITIINADFIELDFQTILDEFSNVGDDILSSQVGANANYMDEHCKSNEDRRGEHCEPVFHIKVVANLPYYITSPIINILLQNPYISEMTLMVQKEVAERIVATPGGRDYGILTLACNYFADTEMIMVVSKDCFFPKPKVDSAVVHFKKHLTAGPASVGAKLASPTPVGASTASPLFKLIKASFAQRRKKLLNSLTNAGYDKNIVSNALLELGFDENVRAENLSLDDYKRLLTFFHNL